MNAFESSSRFETINSQKVKPTKGRKPHPYKLTFQTLSIREEYYQTPRKACIDQKEHLLSQSQQFTPETINLKNSELLSMT